MTAEATAAPASGISLLLDWAGEQDQWVRRLVSDVIETRRRLSDERVAAVYALLLREKQLAPGSVQDVPLPSASAVGASAAPPLRLVSLEHVAGVNALATNQEIRFHERFTVCFGENASGKTGYVRILKRAASARTAEPVLPNICVERRADPEARIKVRVGDDERTVDWHGEQGVEPLTRLNVFDARAAVVHLAEDLSYAYTPAELSLFPLVMDGVDRVRAKLDQDRQARQPGTNPFVARFQRGSSIYAKIEALDASTDLAELDALANVSAEEEASLDGLREKVTALGSSSTPERVARARQQRNAYAQLLDVVRAITGFDRAAYQQALETLGAARERHGRATRAALADEDIPGMFGEEWKRFIEAAEAYITGLGLEAYPEADAACVYCRQPLGEPARELLQKYRDYCNDALRQAVNDAEHRVQALVAPIRGLNIDGAETEIRRTVQAASDEAPPAPGVKLALQVAEYAQRLKQAILAQAPPPEPPPDLERVEAVVKQAVQEADKNVADLQKQGEERAQALRTEQARLLDLEARLTLKALMPQVREHVDGARWADRAATHLRRFQGLKRSLTEQAKRASAEVLNRDFQRRFDREAEALRAPRVTLDFPGREGEARRRKLLTPEHGLGDILSEGEQKVVALADFLAEASLKPDRAPIVLDDPVTSLDHKRLRHVVDRLVELSRERQVIVFTHDIWFAAEILARFESDPRACGFNDVTADNERVGLVAPGTHPKTDTFNDRKRRILNVLREADEATGETRHALIEKGYEILRGACEIVVEKDLLKGVTERYRPNVRMTVLGQIAADRLPAAISAIVPVFEKCCRVIASHSQPLATQGVRPTVDDLRADWNTLQEARKAYLGS